MNKRVMFYQEKWVRDICFDWIDDTTAVLHHQPFAIPVSLLYTNSSVVISSYFILASRRLPLLSHLLSTNLGSLSFQRILVLSFYVSSLQAPHLYRGNTKILKTQTLYPHPFLGRPATLPCQSTRPHLM
jgi:hypothetical protein